MYGPDSEPPKPFADYDDEEDELEEGERTYFPGS
jgi:hypothetical protein